MATQDSQALVKNFLPCGDELGVTIHHPLRLVREVFSFQQIGN